MTTKSEITKELVRVGAVQRLSDLNKERDLLLKILGKDKDDKADHIIAKSKKPKQKKFKKSLRERKEISRRMKAYWSRQRKG